MKKFIQYLFVFLLFCLAQILSGEEIVVKVQVKEKSLKQFQDVAKVELPLPEYGSVYVTDVTGLKVNSIRIKPVEKFQRSVIYFKTNQQDFYYVRWLSEERKSETQIFEIPEGKIIFDDYLNPSARTSGFWFWLSNPRLSGSFSHTDRGQQRIKYHYTSIIPALKAKQKDIVYQYLFLDPNNVPEEIVVEIQIDKRRSYYFSWGSDEIKWKGLNKISMGKMPEKGKWQPLVIPVEKMGKEIEISGIGFYSCGGKAYWDYTTIGNLPLETTVVEWNKKGSKISAFFNKEISGPFRFSDKTFYAVFFDGSPSTNVETFIWSFDNKKYYEKNITASFEGKPVSVSLTCINSKLKSSDVFSETIIFQKKEPEEVNLFLKILPHRNLIGEGESFYLPVQAGSLMSVVVPVEIVAGNIKEFFKILPGKENACNLNLFFPAKPDVYNIELKIADVTVTKKSFRFANIDDLDEKNIDGPFLVEKDGTRIAGIIPEYKLKNSTVGSEIKRITFIGDFPSEFFNIFKQNTNIEIDWLKCPEVRGYHTILNLFWLKKQIESQQLDTVVVSPSLNSLLHRTPLDEYISALDASIWFLSKKAKRIICLTPFPSTPDAKIFKPYAERTVSLCKKRNVNFLDLYEVYTKMPEWENLFLEGKGIYKNFPSEKGILLFFEALSQNLKVPLGSL